MRFAVIAPWHGRHEATLPLIRRVMVESTRLPDEFWIVVEDADDLDVAIDALDTLGLRGSNSTGIELVMLPTPRTEKGGYAVIPYSHKINLALNRTSARCVCYLDNHSVPAETKYETMALGLQYHPIVYVSQRRSGYVNEDHLAIDVIPDGHSRVNFTQVAHEITGDRWTEDMHWANPDLADALFWRSLAISLGPMYPVGGTTILDWHQMNSAAAEGIND